MKLKAKPILGLVMGSVLLAGCGGNKEQPIAADAAAGTDCVNRAAAIFGVDLQYISVSSVGKDPSGVYPSAIEGTVQRSAGVQTKFYCRLDSSQSVVDVVTPRS